MQNQSAPIPIRRPQRSRLRGPLDMRTWAQIEKAPDHWWWRGTTDKDGYGYICEGGSARKGAKYLRTHRVVWALVNGPIPDGMQVLHSCDTPSCVNPAHLFLGTNLDNVADRETKERNRRGENHGNAKLTDEAVREIRRRYATGGISQQRLADEFNINQTIVSDVVRRVLWKHVTDDEHLPPSVL